jgi:hypothetical protein
MKMKIFVIANIAVVAMVTLLWLAPLAGDVFSGRENLRLLERRYTAERAHANMYTGNLHRLEELLLSREILCYSQMIPAISEVSRSAAGNNLNTIEFSSAEVRIAEEAEFSRLYEKQVSAEYEGDLYGLVDFLYNLSDVSVRSFYIETRERARLRLEFSVFGSGTF